MLKIGSSTPFRTLRKCIFFATLIVAIGTPVQTYAQEKGPISAIVEALGKLIEGITNVNIESATLGMDKGIISGLVIGIGRTVERNPFPTGEHDQFLVKDRMRLGYELGAGYVIAGTASYIQEWTLVYPVPTSLKGTLSRKFLVDLFLPYRVKKWESDKLPREYALIRESYLEGKARLKMGGVVPFSLGNEGSIGRVKMSSVLSRRYKNGDIDLIREQSVYNKIAYEIWMNLILFDLPVFDSYKNYGKLTRTYNKIKFEDLPEKPRREMLKSLFTGMESQPLSDFINENDVDREVRSKFIESYLSLTLFGLFNKDTYRREDYVTDTIYERDPETGLLSRETETLWQFTDRHLHDWTTGAHSELYRSEIFLNAEPQVDDRNVVINMLQPQLRLNLMVQDWDTSEREFNEVYLPLSRAFAHSEQKDLGEALFDFDDEPESVLNVEVQYSESDLRKILHTTEDQWYKKLEEMTGKKKVYWLRAKEDGFHGRDRRRLRQTKLPFNEIQLAKKLGSLIRLLERARKIEKKKPVASLRTLALAIRKMFDVGREAWDIRLLNVLQKIVGRPQFNGVKFQQFRKGEGNLERVTSFSTHSGTSEWIDRFEHQFLLQDPFEIYHFFDLESLGKF